MDVDLDKSKANLENGEAKENMESGSNSDLTLKEDTSENSSSSSPNVTSLKTSRVSHTSSPSTPAAKKPKPSIDLTNPNYLKPFQHGWKRELVYRVTSDNSTKRNGDIYYYTPSGRKVRSMREVSENLKNKKLTLNNFTFLKEPLGLDDPEKEIIRDAKLKSSSLTPAAKKGTPKPLKTSKTASPKVTGGPGSPPDSSKTKNSPRLGGFKIKLPSRGSQQAKSKADKKSKDDLDLEVGKYPPLSPHSAIQDYVRKNCQLDQDPNTGCTAAVAPPPLTPINALKSVKTQSTVLPKLDDSELDVSNIKTKPQSPSKLTTLHPDNEPRAEGPMDVDKSSEKVQDGIAKPAIEENSKESEDDEQETKKSKRLSKQLASVDREETEDMKFMDCYLQNLAYGYNTLLYVFQYLKMQDLLRASCVCSMWQDIASHVVLWRTVRMKNSQIHSFEGLADALETHGTIHLDLRKMLLPSSSSDDIWHEFSRAIKKVESLRKIELCRCPATVVEQLALSNPKLEVINAVTIKCESISLAPLVFLTNLQELRLKSTAGFSLTSDLTALSDLKQLKHLSLTSIKGLNKLNIDVIADLRNLESLDLGECADFPKTFGGEILTRLNKLEKLRLEKGQGNCYTLEILEAVKNMPHLEQLELVNFDIKTGFDRALRACTNIKKLLIIPTYISHGGTTNHVVLSGVLGLKTTLSHFVWGIPLEMLERVTQCFVGQCNSILVSIPMPLLIDAANLENLPSENQFKILPLPEVQNLLLQSLPTTRVKILKIPFHATWRQSITD